MSHTEGIGRAFLNFTRALHEVWVLRQLSANRVHIMCSITSLRKACPRLAIKAGLGVYIFILPTFRSVSSPHHALLSNSLRHLRTFPTFPPFTTRACSGPARVGAIGGGVVGGSLLLAAVIIWRFMFKTGRLKTCWKTNCRRRSCWKTNCRCHSCWKPNCRRHSCWKTNCRCHSCWKRFGTGGEEVPQSWSILILCWRCWCCWFCSFCTCFCLENNPADGITQGVQCSAVAPAVQYPTVAASDTPPPPPPPLCQDPVGMQHRGTAQ